MSVLDTSEIIKTENLTFLPDIRTPDEHPVANNPLQAALNTIDFFGSIAGSLVGFVAAGVTGINDFIDRRL